MPANVGANASARAELSSAYSGQVNGSRIAEVGALVGDPTRAQLLTLLLDGRASTVGELARASHVALSTASGHLTRLRRTRVGGYGLDQAHTLDQLASSFEVLPLAQAASAAFPGRQLTEDEARRLAHGGRLAASAGADATCATGAGTDVTGGGGAAAVTDPRTPTAAYAPDGTLIALLTEESGQARPLVVFA